MTQTHTSVRRAVLGGLAAALCAPALVRAQAPFPTRNVRIVLPQPPGGAADRLARMLADRLEARWKQPVVLDNKPGGGVVVGTLATVRAAGGRLHHRPAGQLAEHQRRAAHRPAVPAGRPAAAGPRGLLHHGAGGAGQLCRPMT
jgi:hypothetical protein